MKTKTEWKVGLFIAISLAIAVGLVLNFAKGISPLTKTYSLNLATKNVDGIVKNAVVMMAGVPIGKVTQITLNTDKSEVSMKVQIEEIYNIIHLFCYWNNTQYTYQQRIELCKKNLKKILKHNNLKLITMIIDKIQQTHSFISYDNYQLLLKELIDKYDKINTKITDNKAFILQKFHIENDVFKHKLKNVREFVKWIYI